MRFWIMTQCILTFKFSRQRLGRTLAQSLYFYAKKIWTQFYPKRCNTSPKLHDVTYQKTVILKPTTEITSDFQFTKSNKLLSSSCA